MFVLYTLAHGFILALGNAVYWDDWSLLGANRIDILNEFSQLGAYHAAWIHIALLNNLGPWSYKIATFFCVYFSGVLFYWILQRDMFFDKKMALLIAILYLTVPLNIARVAAINFPYTLSVFCFMFAWWRMVNSKWISLVFFSLAFTTQSLLVFYALPIASQYLREGYKCNLLKYIRDNIQYLALPFVWFTLKFIYSRPYGDYAGYNEAYAFSHIVSSVGLQISDFASFVREDLVSSKTLGGAAIFFLPILLLHYVKKFNFELSFRRGLLLLTLGLAVFILGCFPYWILGITPTFWEWTSRHQLLMPFASSIILATLAGILYGPIRELTIFLMLTLFVSINFSNYYDFYRDWAKQKELIRLMSGSELIKKSTLIIFVDRTPNAIRRNYRSYEWNGLLNRAFPYSGTRYGLPIGLVAAYENGVYDKSLNRYYTTRSFVKISARNALMVEILERDGLLVLEETPFGIRANGFEWERVCQYRLI